MKSTIDKQLAKILTGEIESLPDTIPSSNDNEQTEEIEEVAELVPVVFEPKTTSIELSNGDIQEDYIFARSNMYGLISRANSALELALKIGAMSEHPRALEVAAALIKMSSDVSKDLITIHKEIENSKSNIKDEKSKKYTQINNYYGKGEEKKVDDILDSISDDN